MREVRRRPPSDEWTAVSGADPLNLAGILTPGPRLAALAGNRLLYRDGVPTATLSGGEIRFVEQLDAATEWFARKALVRGAGRGSSLVAEWARRRPTPRRPVPETGREDFPVFAAFPTESLVALRDRTLYRLGLRGSLDS